VFPFPSRQHCGSWGHSGEFMNFYRCGTKFIFLIFQKIIFSCCRLSPSFAPPHLFFSLSPLATAHLPPLCLPTPPFPPLSRHCGSLGHSGEFLWIWHPLIQWYTAYPGKVHREKSPRKVPRRLCCHCWQKNRTRSSSATNTCRRYLTPSAANNIFSAAISEKSI
jgi:hypothetical protein